MNRRPNLKMSPIVYSRNLLKISIAQILQTIGFQTAQSTAIDVLVEILERYIMLIGRSAHEYAELASRTEPTLEDLASTFSKYKVTIDDLNEYMKWVDTPEFALAKHNDLRSICMMNDQLPKTSKAVPASINLSKTHRRHSKSHREYLGYCDDPDHKEMLERQSDEEYEYVYDYMPLMTHEQTNQIEIEPPTSLSVLIPSPENDTPIVNNLNNENNVMESSEFAVESAQTKQRTEEQSTVIKEGKKYTNYTWKSKYEPKYILSHVRSRQHLLPLISHSTSILQRAELADTSTSSMKRPEGSSVADMVTENAQSEQTISETQNARVVTPLARMPEYYHKPSCKYKKQIYANAVTFTNKANSNYNQLVDELLEEEMQARIKQANLQQRENLTELSAEQQFNKQILLEAGGGEPGFVEQLEAGVNSPKLGSLDEVAAERAANDDQLLTVDQQISLTATTSSPVSSKSKVDQMLESMVNKYTSHSSVSSANKPLQKAQNSANLKIKIKEKSIVQDESSVNVSLEQQQQVVEKVPKLKINLSTATSQSFSAKSSEQHKQSEFNFTQTISNNSTSQFLTTYNKNEKPMDELNPYSFEPVLNALPQQTASSTYDDDNAMDGLNLAANLKSASEASSGTNLIEPLIWKPICNLNSSRSNSPPPVEVTPAENSENLIACSSIPAGQKTSAIEALSLRTNILVDYSSNTTDSSRNFIDSKEILFQTESRKEEPLEGSSKHKKKKKNKDKEKSKSKDKDKEKEKEKDKEKGKKHHHHHHHQKKKKDKHKSKEKSAATTGAEDSMQASNEQPGGSSSSSKKKDKKLKKLLKKQKKLEKLAAASAMNGIKTAQEDANVPTSGNINKEAISSTSVSAAQPPLPKLKLNLKLSNETPPPSTCNPNLKRQPSHEAAFEAAIAVVGSNSNSNASNASMHSQKSSCSSSTVKPFKLNLGLITSNLMEQNEDEIELGEIVRPRPGVNYDSGGNRSSPASSGDQFPKLIIKPLNNNSNNAKKESSKLKKAKSSNPTTSETAGESIEINSKKRKTTDFEYEQAMGSGEKLLKSKHAKREQAEQPRSLVMTSGYDQVLDQINRNQSTEWHLQRVKHEEEMLREQLIALNMSRLSQMEQKKPHASSASASSTNVQSNNLKATKKSESVTSALNSSSQMKKSRVSQFPTSKIFSSYKDIAGTYSKNPITHLKSDVSRSEMQIIGTAVNEVVSNQLWTCPSCNKHDESLPMIGCDSCDDWYHWHCIGIKEEPPENQNWYCSKCGKTDETITISSSQSQSQQAENTTFSETNSDNINENTLYVPYSNASATDYLLTLKKKKKST